MRSSDPVADFARYDSEQMALDAAIKAEQDNTDPTPEDYSDAMEMLDTVDLLEVIFNHLDPIGSAQWIADVVEQCNIDQKQLDEWAEHVKNDRVAWDFRED